MVRVQWELDQGIAGQLSAAVEDLHVSTGRPEHEVVSEVIQAGLGRLDDVEARLSSRRVEAAVAALPPDSRPLPDMSVYDQLLAGRRCTAAGTPAQPG
jgi:hypothetical protein